MSVSRPSGGAEENDQTFCALTRYQERRYPRLAVCNLLGSGLGVGTELVAERLKSSLRYCLGEQHALWPVCPDHHVPLRWTNGGELARCNLPTSRDSRGRRTWCKFQRSIICYDDLGRPLPTREFPVRTIGSSVRRL